MHKPTIYFVLASQPFLEPISGDRINEMNLIRALCIHFDVYYNNVLVDPNTNLFGRRDTKIEPPNRKYDLHYVRANKDLFLSLPHPKIWFATPYCPECYEQADAVATMTEAWHRQMGNFNHNPWLQTVMGVDGQPAIRPKKLVLMRQAIDHESLKVNHERAASFREEKDGRLIIGHFGRVVKSNFPHHLIEVSRDREISERFRFIFRGKVPQQLNEWFTVEQNVPQAEVPSAIAACDATIYNQDTIGNIAGSIKVMESMALGIPIIATRLEARIRELGETYPYFWSYSEEYQNWLDVAQLEFQSTSNAAYQRALNHSNGNYSFVNRFREMIGLGKRKFASHPKGRFMNDVEKLKQTLKRFSEDPKLREKTSAEIKKRSLNYSVTNVAEALKNDLFNVLNDT